MKPAIERGEKCYNARLTEEQVRLARIYVMQGPVGVLPQLARKWGVGQQTLRNAVIYKNWKHIHRLQQKRLLLHHYQAGSKLSAEKPNEHTAGDASIGTTSVVALWGYLNQAMVGSLLPVARLMPLHASRTNQWICDRWLASDSASSSAYSSSPFMITALMQCPQRTCIGCTMKPCFHCMN
jgi:hypothetical protein